MTQQHNHSSTALNVWLRHNKVVPTVVVEDATHHAESRRGSFSNSDASYAMPPVSPISPRSPASDSSEPQQSR